VKQLHNSCCALIVCGGMTKYLVLQTVEIPGSGGKSQEDRYIDGKTVLYYGKKRFRKRSYIRGPAAGSGAGAFAAGAVYYPAHPAEREGWKGVSFCGSGEDGAAASGRPDH